MVMMAPIDIRKPPVKLPVKQIDPALIDRMNFAFKDKDGDGKLTRDEYVGGAKGKERFAKQFEFEKHDLNGDNVITREEYMASRQVERLKKKPPVRDRIKDWFKPSVLEKAPEWIKPWMLRA